MTTLKSKYCFSCAFRRNKEVKYCTECKTNFPIIEKCKHDIEPNGNGDIICIKCTLEKEIGKDLLQSIEKDYTPKHFLGNFYTLQPKQTEWKFSEPKFIGKYSPECFDKSLLLI